MGFIKEMQSLLTEEASTIQTSASNLIPIDRDFIIRLANYIDSRFPAYGGFDNDIYNEIRKKMDETDPKMVLKIKSKIHKIVIDEKKKFLDRVQNRIAKIMIPEKKE